jgi:hydroxyacylglutathione hydrolase
MPVEVFAVPALKDNYIWVLHRSEDGSCLVIDPGDARPVEEFMDARGWRVGAVLNTHHHPDHTAGNARLKERYDCPVFANIDEPHKVPAVTDPVSPGTLWRWNGWEAKVLALPGHTLGQIAFYFANPGGVFVGDTLFPMGCGRLFEGSAEQMLASLKSIMALPARTLIYCGHEYALQNAAFAGPYMDHRDAFQRRSRKLQRLRDEGLPSVPSTVEEEAATNPFLNAGDPEVKRRLGMASADELQSFTELRKRKDRF